MAETKGNNRHITIGGKNRKAERRAAAFVRDAEAAKLSLKEKLARLPPEGANRQRARYTALLAKQAEKQADGEKQKRKKERTQEAAQQLVAQKQGA